MRYITQRVQCIHGWSERILDKKITLEMLISVRLSDARGITTCALFQVNEHLNVTLEKIYAFVRALKPDDFHRSCFLWIRAAHWHTQLLSGIKAKWKCAVIRFERF